MVLQARAYPGFLSLKGLGALLLPPGWELVHPKGTSPSLPSPQHFSKLFTARLKYIKIFGEIVLSISLQNIWLPSWIFNAEGDRGENEISREGVWIVHVGGEKDKERGGTLLLHIKHGKSLNN